MAEGAPLLREYTSDGIEGSNPSLSAFAPVAQLDRALGYEPRGQGFESLRARHFNNYTLHKHACMVLTLNNLLCYNHIALRKVAQFGSARGLGP